MQEDLFPLKGYEDLEISTQLVIAEALRRGLKVEVLARKENFIRLSRDGIVELILQATRTEKDSYITGLVLADKELCKILLKEQGIEVPGGECFYSEQEAKQRYEDFKDSRVVVKPKTTNFGIGITIFEEPGTSRRDFDNAVDSALSHDSAVIVEEFIDGSECRFLVLGDSVFAVTHRKPASVTGDGVSTIAQLVETANRDPRRGEDYTALANVIQVGNHELSVLAQRGYGLESIPADGEEVFLRKNSNISTGGDSFDITDDIDSQYKELAVRAAQSVNALICGVDMILQDWSSPPVSGNHSILELNFNPGLRVHRFPFEGTSRSVECDLLDLLGFPKR